MINMDMKKVGKKINIATTKVHAGKLMSTGQKRAVYIFI